MALEFKITTDTKAAKKKLDDFIRNAVNKNQRLKQSTEKVRQANARLALSADKLVAAARKQKLSTERLIVSEQKHALGLSNVKRAQDRLRVSTTGLTAKIGALRNQLLLVTFATAGIVGAVTTSIKTFGIQEKAVARLNANMENVLVSFFGLERGSRLLALHTKRSTDLLIEQAQALQRITTFGDEVTISAQAMLSTFALSAKEVMKLTPALLDMAAASEKTTGKQVDLEQIAIAVGKSLTIGVGSLTRYGVVISDTARDSFKLATESEKVNIILAELNKNFSGVAEAIAKTDIGKLQQIGNIIADFQEDIGGFNIKVVSRLIEDLNTKFITPLKELGKQGAAIKKFFGELGKAMLFAIPGMEEFGDATGDAVENLKELERIKIKVPETFEGMVERLTESNKEMGRLDFLTGQTLEKVESIFKFEGDRLVMSEKIFMQKQKMVELESVHLDLIQEGIDRAKNITIDEANKERTDALAASQDALNVKIEESRRLGQAFANTILQAQIHGTSLKNTFRAILSQLISFAISKGFSAALPVPTPLAHGTNFFKGGTALVGERGPEIVNLPRGTQVIPNNQISTTNNNNTSTINLNFPNVRTFDKFTVETQIMPLIRESISEGEPL